MNKLVDELLKEYNFLNVIKNFSVYEYIYKIKTLINNDEKYKNISFEDVMSFTLEKIIKDNELNYVDYSLGVLLNRENLVRYGIYAAKSVYNYIGHPDSSFIANEVIKEATSWLKNKETKFTKYNNSDFRKYLHEANNYEIPFKTAIKLRYIATNKVKSKLYQESIGSIACDAAKTHYFYEDDEFACRTDIIKYGINLYKEQIKENEYLLSEIKINNEVKSLKKDPILINNCKYLDKFTIDHWVDIINDQPILINYCNKIDEFDDYNWYKMLIKNPILIDKLDYNLVGEAKRDLLAKNPSLIKELSINNINKKDLEKLTINSKEYYFEFIKKYIKQYRDKDFLTDMIIKHSYLIKLYDKNNLWKDIDLTKAINNNEKLEKIYTKRDLWKYVDFNKLTNFKEYGILK